MLQLFAELQVELQQLAAGTMDAAPLRETQPRLSKRLRQFLKLLCDGKGYTYKEIAAKMGCHTSTLRTYRERLAERYDIRGKAALVGWAVARGLG